jgi:2-haloacid dehalogenase
MKDVSVCVFDAYGTLFDVHSGVRRYVGQIGDSADALSKIWRVKQLEYTWVRSLMKRHLDFQACTADALDFAMSQLGMDNRPELRRLLLDAYLTLDVYPEVRGVLEALQSKGIRTAILSNGTIDMLRAAVRSADLESMDLPLLSVEPAGIFKPDASVYRLATDYFGVTIEEISFQSSNAWDIAGARAFGFRAVWINRSHQPDEYGLRGSVPELPSLETLPEFVLL